MKPVTEVQNGEYQDDPEGTYMSDLGAAFRVSRCAFPHAGFFEITAETFHTYVEHDGIRQFLHHQGATKMPAGGPDG